MCLNGVDLRLRAVKLSASSGRAAPGRVLYYGASMAQSLSVRQNCGVESELVDCSNKRALQQLREVTSDDFPGEIFYSRI